jgi:hypothetical protein
VYTIPTAGGRADMRLSSGGVRSRCSTDVRSVHRDRSSRAPRVNEVLPTAGKYHPLGTVGISAGGSTRCWRDIKDPALRLGRSGKSEVGPNLR